MFNRMGAERGLAAAFEVWKFDALDAPGATRHACAAAPPPGRAQASQAAPDTQVLLKQLRERAVAEGYEAGLAAGRTEGLRLAQIEAARWRALLASLGGALGQMHDEVGSALLGLALDVSRQVLRTELAQCPEAMLPAVREALELGGQHSHAQLNYAQLHLNPADREFVSSQLQDLLAAGGWTVLEDSAIEAGGCRVSTPNGSIDATLATRWQRVAAALGSGDVW